MKTEREIELEKQVAELRAALGVYQASADWVPRADHHAELRRVAEAVQHDLWYALKAALGPGKHQQVLSREVDLARERIDAIVRGGQGDGFNELDVAVYQEARAALADTNLGHDYVPRAELVGAEQQIAAWRILAERARKHLAESIHGEECLRSDECDDADPGECGNHDPGYCPACDCGVSEWHETAAELHAALKETT